MNKQIIVKSSIKHFGLVGLIAFAILAFVAPFVFDKSLVSLFYLILYFICLTGAWNLFSGFSGYINFGFVAFIGIGMYASVISIVNFSIWWPIAWVLGGFISAAFAGAISYPVSRTRGAYFAISMLAIAEGTRVLVATKYLDPITRGGRGIPVIAADLTSKYYGMLLIVLVLVGVTYKMATTRFGLQLLSIREDEVAAEGLGINTTAVKIIAFIISAFFAGIAGGIHATFLHYIDPPSAFDIKFTVLPIIMAMFGGLGTVLGPVIAGLVLEVINNWTWLYLGRINMAVFGVVLIFLVFSLPQGVITGFKEAGILPKTRKI
jgi:branched-chain amino acid transport system permease protein